MDPMGMDIVTPPKRNVKTSLKFTTIEVGFCCSFLFGSRYIYICVYIYIYIWYVYMWCRNCNHSKLDVELSNTFGFQKGLLLTVHILSTQGWLHIYYYILLWQLLTKWFIIHQKLFCIVIRDASPNFPRTFLVVHFWIKAFFISILHHIAIFVCSTGSTVTPWWISGTDVHLDRSRWLEHGQRQSFQPLRSNPLEHVGSLVEMSDLRNFGSDQSRNLINPGIKPCSFGMVEH